jgi:tetratricopeptide (TPR) repeat protein
VSSAAAVIGPDLLTRLADAGIARELAARTAQAVEQQAATRYGGTAEQRAATPPGDVAELRALVDALDTAFAAGDASKRSPPARRESGCTSAVTLALVAAAATLQLPRASTPLASDELERAALAYRAGQFQQAHALFARALEAADAPRGAVLFHLGNCAYRLGRRAEAIWHYRRALLRLPRDREVHANLQLVERQLGVDPPPSTFLDTLLAPMHALTLGELLGLGTLLQGLGAVGFLLSRGRRRRRLLLVVAALGAGCAARAAHMQWLQRPSAAVVLGVGADLRQEPHATAATVVALRTGESLRIDALAVEWLHVTHALGSGFVPRGLVGIVD